MVPFDAASIVWLNCTNRENNMAIILMISSQESINKWSKLMSASKNSY